MKLTKSQLKRIIKEELEHTLLVERLLTEGIEQGIDDLVSTFGKQAQMALKGGEKGKEGELEEAVGILTAASVALVVPAIMKMVSGAARLVNIGIKKLSTGGSKSEGVKAFADWMEKKGEALHHKYVSVFTTIAEKVFRLEGEDAERVGQAMYYLLIATLAVASGVGAAHAAEHAEVPLAALESALAAIKGGEVGIWLKGAVGV